jgi:hypothetical protein
MIKQNSFRGNEFRPPLSPGKGDGAFLITTILEVRSPPFAQAPPYVATA